MLHVQKKVPASFKLSKNFFINGRVLSAYQVFVIQTNFSLKVLI